MTDSRRFRRGLALVCCLYFAASLLYSSWGLPNGNRTWAADSVAPMTPLAVAYRTFVENGFDSGYFYFKYPVGHQLVLAALTAPVMAVAYLSSDLSGVQTDYPFGLDSPDAYLTAMAIVARTLSAVFATGCVAIVGLLARRLAGGSAGLLAAVAAAGCYPLLFYAHTSNVETAFLFWALLALYAAVLGVEDRRPRWLWAMGFACAMAVSTKEQILGFVILVPAAMVARHALAGPASSGLGRLVPRGAVAGGGIALLTWLGINAAFYNPSGFLNRIRFLTHTLPPEVRERYSAYEFPLDFSTSWSLGDEIAHLGKALHAVVSSLGWPAALAALGGIGWLVFRRRGEALYLLAAGAGYYLVSLRVLKQVELRYVLPWSVLAAVPAGVLIARALGGRPVVRAAGLLTAAFGLVYSLEVLPLLSGDARYAAEKWMAPYLERGHSVEVYQSWTYLPRWERIATVSKPPPDRMSAADVQRRGPDFIVISSKGKEGITMYPNPDWRDGRGMMLVREDNVRMLELLEAGDLGYERVRRFERGPLIPREMITSLAPSIDVYRRTEPPSAPAVVTTGAD